MTCEWRWRTPITTPSCVTSTTEVSGTRQKFIFFFSKYKKFLKYISPSLFLKEKEEMNPDSYYFLSWERSWVFFKVNRKILRIHHAEQPQQCQPNFNTRPHRAVFNILLPFFSHSTHIHTHRKKKENGESFLVFFQNKTPPKKNENLQTLGRGGHIENGWKFL